MIGTIREPYTKTTKRKIRWYHIKTANFILDHSNPFLFSKLFLFFGFLTFNLTLNVAWLTRNLDRLREACERKKRLKELYPKR
jgi:hypothetical protein